MKKIYLDQPGAVPFEEQETEKNPAWKPVKAPPKRGVPDQPTETPRKPEHVPDKTPEKVPVPA